MGKGGMPPKKSSLTSRRAKGGRSKPKRRMSDDDETALRNRRLLEAEVDRLRQQLAATQSELETQQKQVAATIGGLTGTGRGLMRRSLEEKPASAGQGKAKRRKVELEPIRERKKRLEVELQSASNRRGRSRSYEENRTFIFSCLKLEVEVLESCTGNDRPILNKIADAVARMQGYDNKFGKLLMSNWRDDQSILVHESQTRGKGSPGYRDGTYIDTARRLAPEHLKAIEEYRRELHKTGGVCSVRTIVNHLNEKFEIEGSSQASLFPLPSRSCFRSSLP